MVRPFRFSVGGGTPLSAKALGERARKAEASGYSTYVLSDHLLDTLAPNVALAAIAAVTSTLRIGHFVLNNDLRHPVVLHQELATLDVLSEGRLDIGIGAGWNEPEYRGSGIAFEAVPDRVSRLEEAVAVLKGLFRDEPLSFAGRHYTITAMDGRPKPVQRPHPPIHVSGHSPGSLDRAATYGQGWYGYFITPDETRAIVQSLASRLHARDRTWENFQITVTPPQETVLDATTLRAYETAGVTLLLPIVSWPRGASLEQILDPLVQATRALSQ